MPYSWLGADCSEGEGRGASLLLSQPHAPSGRREIQQDWRTPGCSPSPNTTNSGQKAAVQLSRERQTDEEVPESLHQGVKLLQEPKGSEN